MSSEKFELAEDEVDTFFEKIEGSMAKYRSSKGEGRRSDDKRQMSMRLRGHFDEAKTLIDEMEFEARKAPLTFRGDMLSNVREHRASLAGFQNELNRSEALPSSEDNFPSAAAGLTASEDEDPVRRQILMGAAALDRTTEMVRSSTQVALETENIGETIISDLGTQRETLQRTRTRLAETDADLGRSRRLLRRIYFGVVQNRLCLILVIIIQIIIIIFIIYWKFIRARH
eukprot:TRINITY_DN6991_c0_g1_i1.p1 TRINITY_DN6991_c0_g1~~TRINITY_DN6991_c0_g1_i1.p1  ORF type:complete len:229 (-),score=59.76 TRINITY_DN6991_c0_g1_i1:396-1082(-)